MSKQMNHERSPHPPLVARKKAAGGSLKTLKSGFTSNSSNDDFKDKDKILQSMKDEFNSSFNIKKKEVQNKKQARKSLNGSVNNHINTNGSSTGEKPKTGLTLTLKKDKQGNLSLKSGNKPGRPKKVKVTNSEDTPDTSVNNDSLGLEELEDNSTQNSDHLSEASFCVSEASFSEQSESDIVTDGTLEGQESKPLPGFTKSGKRKKKSFRGGRYSLNPKKKIKKLNRTSNLLIENVNSLDSIPNIENGEVNSDSNIPLCDKQEKVPNEETTTSVIKTPPKEEKPSPGSRSTTSKAASEDYRLYYSDSEGSESTDQQNIEPVNAIDTVNENIEESSISKEELVETNSNAENMGENEALKTEEKVEEFVGMDVQPGMDAEEFDNDEGLDEIPHIEDEDEEADEIGELAPPEEMDTDDPTYEFKEEKDEVTGKWLQL